MASPAGQGGSGNEQDHAPVASSVAPPQPQSEPSQPSPPRAQQHQSPPSVLDGLTAAAPANGEDADWEMINQGGNDDEGSTTNVNENNNNGNNDSNVSGTAEGYDTTHVDASSHLVAGQQGQDLPADGQMAEEQELEIDEADDLSDSALGSDTQSTTTSLGESIYAYRKEHGRTYHAYKDGKYIFPNDEREADRLDLQHHLFNITFDNKLFHAPISDPKNALDVGTGTGIWAVDFADQFPNCQVVGIDLSPGQPLLVPPNLRFIIDDVEDLWMYERPFDYVHLRLIAGCLADWDNFFRQAYDNMEPGGWLELQDYGLPVKSFDGTHEGTNIQKWGELLCEAARKLGRPMGSDVADLYPEKMRAAGFLEVQVKTFMWPSNGWPKDPMMKEIGKWNRINCLEGLEGFCLALMSRALGWRKEEIDIFVAQVTKDFNNKKIHAYFPMPVCYGRKPYPHEL